MREALFLGTMLGIGAAFAVGPIFMLIVQEAATRGFSAGLRVSLGSALADLLLLLPALGFSRLIAGVAQATLITGLVGMLVLLYLAGDAARSARRLWSGQAAITAAGGWSLSKGLVGNLANPLSWTFWLTTGTPTMLRAYALAGSAGLVGFTLTWFGVAVALELLLALVIARTGQMLGARGQAVFNGIAAVMFLGMALTLLWLALG